jgi:hypothetical protein
MKEMLLKITAAIFLLSGCFVWAGCRAASQFDQRLMKLVTPPLARSAGGSYATTDTYLRPLAIAEPSARVLAALSPLPKKDAILFVAPDQDAETELVYRVLATLSWPHEVGALHCAASGGRPFLLFKPREEKTVRWLLLYQLAPSDKLPVAAEIGPHLKLVPITEVKEWTSYCSQ